MNTQQDPKPTITSSPQPKSVQQTTYRYVNTEIASNQKWSHSPYMPKTPVHDTKSHNNRDVFGIKSTEQPSILPVSFEARLSYPPGQESLMSITQLERLKLRLLYLQQQLSILKQQNDQITRQKKTLNQNYVQLINKQLQSEELRHQQQTQLKLTHAQELNHASQQLAAYAQAISRLQVEVSKHEEELNIQTHLWKEKEAVWQGSLQKMENQLTEIKAQSHSFMMKLNSYESLLSKKETQIQQLLNESAVHAKNAALHKGEHESLMRLLSSVQDESRSLNGQNQSLSQAVDQLKSQLSLKQASMSKMSEEMSILLKLDHQSHHELALQQQTIQNLQQQNHSFNMSYSELLSSSQQSLKLMKQNEQSLLSEITALNVLNSRVREENSTLIKHLQNLKDRESLLIESEKSAREKLNSNMEKKNKQIEDLCQQNERLYREINKIKFNNHPFPPSANFNQTQSTFVNTFHPNR